MLTAALMASASRDALKELFGASVAVLMLKGSGYPEGPCTQ